MNKIQMAAQLYDTRDTAKRFLGAEYQDRVTPYKELIQTVMKKNGLEEIPALLKISESQTYQESGVVQMMFMAAVVELIESS